MYICICVYVKKTVFIWLFVESPSDVKWKLRNSPEKATAAYFCVGLYREKKKRKSIDQAVGGLTSSCGSQKGRVELEMRGWSDEKDIRALVSCWQLQADVRKPQFIMCETWSTFAVCLLTPSVITRVETLVPVVSGHRFQYSFMSVQSSDAAPLTWVGSVMVRNGC